MTWYLTASILLIASVADSGASMAESCPNTCSVSAGDPVCGSNGKIYSSLCEMRTESCNIGVEITERPKSECTDICTTSCLEFRDPVCGSDGIVYPNRCLMKQKNCRSEVQERPMKYCLAAFRKGRRLDSRDACPVQCLDLYRPVCGSDGIVYSSICALQQENCLRRENGKEKVFEVPTGLCARPSRCPVSCLPLPDPVCGNDRRIYLNECQLYEKNCGKKMTRIPMSSCKQ